jgi:hypothetical protein
MLSVNDLFCSIKRLYVELRFEKKKHYKCDLSLADYFIDGWGKSKLLGFGEKTSVYDSCLNLSDLHESKNYRIGPLRILDCSGLVIIFLYLQGSIFIHMILLVK